MSYKIGDLVWARMKGYPPWPGKIIEPKPELKRPRTGDVHCVFFFGSENYNWILADNIYDYESNKEKYSLIAKPLRGFKEGLLQIEKELPKKTSKPNAQSVEDELSSLFAEESDEELLNKVKALNKPILGKNGSKSSVRESKKTQKSVEALVFGDLESTSSSVHAKASDSNNNDIAVFNVHASQLTKAPDKSSLRRNDAQQWHDILPVSATTEVAQRSNKPNKTLGASLRKRKIPAQCDSDSSKEENVIKVSKKKGLFLESEAARDLEKAEKLIWQKFASKKKTKALKPETSESSVAVTRPESQNSNMSWIEGEEPRVQDNRDIELSVSTVLHGSQQRETSTVASLLHSFQQLATPVATSQHSSQQSLPSFASTSKFYGSGAKDQTMSSWGKQSTRKTSSKKSSESHASKKGGLSQKSSCAVTNDNAQQNMQRNDNLRRNTSDISAQKSYSGSQKIINSAMQIEGSAMKTYRIPKTTMRSIAKNTLDVIQKAGTTNTTAAVCVKECSDAVEQPRQGTSSKSVSAEKDKNEKTAEAEAYQSSVSATDVIDLQDCVVILEQQSVPLKDSVGVLTGNVQAVCSSTNIRSSLKSNDSRNVIDWSNCVVVIEKEPQQHIDDAAESDAKKSDSGVLVDDTTLTSTSVLTNSRVMALSSEVVIREDSAIPITTSHKMQGLGAKVTAGSFEGQGRRQEPFESTDILKVNSRNKPSGAQALKRSANGGASTSQSVISSKQPKLAAVSVDIDEDEVMIDDEEEEASRSPGCQKEDGNVATISNITVPSMPAMHVPGKTLSATQYKIGFLGLGIMGSALVGNLLITGHNVTVWNRTSSKCREFIGQGAKKVSTPLELIQSCDLIFSCVSDSAALKDLVFGSVHGLLHGVKPGKSFIDFSTVDVDTTTDINEAITVKGGRFLEAQLIGSRLPAENGELVVLAAGDKSLYNDCLSCFEVISKKSFYCGDEIGSATKMKLMVSMMSCCMTASVAECLVLSEKLFVNKEMMLDVIELSWMNSPLIRTQAMAMVHSKYNEPYCRLHLAQKDMALAMGLSGDVSQPMLIAASVNELFKRAKSKGYGDHDMAAICRAVDM